MAQINIDIKDYTNAKDGSILIRKNGKWVLTTFDELNKENKEQLRKVDRLEEKLEGLSRNSQHFVKYAKSHFLVVFNYFKIKVLSGEIDVTDEELLKLDEYVINDNISVDDALNKHEFLLNTFSKLYLEKREMIEFPEV